MERLYQRQLKHSAIRFKLFERLIDKANEKNTPLGALKGMAIAAGLYPDIVHRQCTDLDILYRKHTEAIVCELVRERGFDLPEIQCKAFPICQNVMYHCLTGLVRF